MGVFGFILPLLLVVGGINRLWWLATPLEIQNSLSAYYHAGSMCMAFDGVYRDLFVGILAAISSCLIIYTGFGKLENWLLNISGICLAGVAFFPTDWPEPQAMSACRVIPAFKAFTSSKLLGLPVSIHTTSALAFFLAINLVNVFTAMDTVNIIEDENKKKFWRTIFSVFRFLVPGTLLIVVLLWIIGIIGDRIVLWLEWVGIWAFSFYWLLKSIEILQTKVDEDAIRGNLYRNKQHHLVKRKLP
jgi:small-conductance mechanosensitive channel